ncbi:N-6 DNA methylase [Glaciecola sp. SC05]|uniref:type I restriction-modification system subunit M/S n=1 Tax=Glaciecola sp. SC05 TaxID=1987355 RepID=UPI003526DB0B
MHASLHQLVSNSFWDTTLDIDYQITQLQSACFAFGYMSKNKLLDEQQRYNKHISNDAFATTLNDCISNHFNINFGKVENEELNAFLEQLTELLNAELITNNDLLIAVRELHDKYKNGYVIPDELIDLGVKLAGNDLKSVYFPFEKGCDFAIGFPAQTEVKCETANQADVFYADILAILANRPISITQVDPILSPSLVVSGGLEQFDAVISMPPFSVKIPKKINDIWSRFPETSMMAEVYYLRHMLAQSKNRVVCFVSNGFLFRTAAGEKLFKQDMVDKGWLKAVISLPSNLLNHTGVPISVLIFDKTKTTQEVTFIDASTDDFVAKLTNKRNRLVNIERILSSLDSKANSQICVSTKADEIIENDFNLSPNRYVVSEQDRDLKTFLSKFDLVKLGEVAELIRPQAAKHSHDEQYAFQEFGLSDINPNGELGGSGKTIMVSMLERMKVKKHLIKANDILIVCRGAVGTVCIVPEDIPENAVANQVFAIVRIKGHLTHISAQSIYQYLISHYAKHQLNALATGTTALMLSSKDLSNLDMPIFTEEQRKAIDETRQTIKAKYTQIEELEGQIAQLNKTALTF